MPEEIAMHSSNEKPYSLLVDFSWRKLHFQLHEEHEKAAHALYNIDLKCFKRDNMIFEDVASNTVFAKSELHLVAIDAESKLRDRPLKLQALKRLQLRYTHLSHALKHPNDQSPERLFWRSEWGFKDLDLICLDEQQLPVARFKANIWGVRRIGKIEFAHDRNPISRELREEIVVAAMTLYCLICSRINNVFSLVGAAFYRPPRFPRREPARIVQGEQQGLEGSVEAAKGGE